MVKESEETMSLFRAQIGDVRRREKTRKRKKKERAYKRRSTKWSKRAGFERVGKGVKKVPANAHKGKRQ